MTPSEFDEALTLSIGQISRLAGIRENRTTLRRLHAGGVRIFRIGRRHAVERLALRQAMPGFYEALLERVASMRDFE